MAWLFPNPVTQYALDDYKEQDEDTGNNYIKDPYWLLLHCIKDITIVLGQHLSMPCFRDPVHKKPYIMGGREGIIIIKLKFIIFNNSST